MWGTSPWLYPLLALPQCQTPALLGNHSLSPALGLYPSSSIPLHPWALVPQFPEVDTSPVDFYFPILWLRFAAPPLPTLRPKSGFSCSIALALACPAHSSVRNKGLSKSQAVNESCCWLLGTLWSRDLWHRAPAPGSGRQGGAAYSLSTSGPRPRRFLPSQGSLWVWGP